MDLLRYALAGLWGGWRRTLAALLAVFTAVTSFVLLTGSAETQRLEVTQTVEGNFRGAYDLLVRPKGSTTALEAANGQVRSSFLSGVYGGITLDQVEQIKSLGGSEVVAPIAMLGVTFQTFTIPLDITSLLPAGQQRGLFRYRIMASSRSGALRLPAYRGFVYVTRAPFTVETIDVDQPNGEHFHSDAQPTEIVDGRKRHPCMVMPQEEGSASSDLWQPLCVSLATPGVGSSGGVSKEPGIHLPLMVTYPLSIAAIDPAAEAQLVGLDAAVSEGRALSDRDSWKVAVAGQDPDRPPKIPPRTVGMVVTGAAADYTNTVTVETLPESAAKDFALLDFLEDDDAPMIRRAKPIGPGVELVTSGDALFEKGQQSVVASEQWGADGADPALASLPVHDLYRPSEVAFAAGTPLRPEPESPASYQIEAGTYLPVTMQDTAFRRISAKRVGPDGYETTLCAKNLDACAQQIGIQVVGRFDAAKVREGATLGRVPLETYSAADLVAADDATRDILGGDVMRSNLDPAGYAQLPPSLLIPIKALPMFEAAAGQISVDAPVSAVRIRVAGVTGPDEESRERIRVVAERIREATGLDVDIMAGSSPLPQRVELPATKLGVPALNLNELWAKKGVAITIIEALDLKSVLLFVLILVSSSLTVAVVARASLAARRHELGVLKATGWTDGRVTGALLLEAALIGLAAGVLGAIISWPLAAAVGVAFDPLRTGLAVPTALLLTVLASLAAAMSAARLSSVSALTPPTTRGGSWLRVRGPVSLGLVSLLRRPGRVVAGVLSVALASGSLLFLLAVSQVFNGAVVGTLLGDAVALQVRTPDVIAAAMLAILGLIAVGVILFLGITEDARDYASLAASGWHEGQLGLSLAAQSVALGLFGALVGIGGALAAVLGFAGSLPAGLLGYAALMAGLAVLGCVVAGLLPAVALTRLPVARLLAGD